MKINKNLPNKIYKRLQRVKTQTFGSEREKVEAFGTIREKERFGLIKRPHYAYGLLRAADLAKYFGKQQTTVCEFGVASGAGLLNMINVAEKITAETGVKFRILGFDTGEGMPEICGYKDHPEMWSPGDYPMVDREELTKKLKGRAELVLGDIKDTVGQFVDNLDADAPIGFIAIDVDIYTSTTHALKCLLGNPEYYNPAVSVYFDDITTFFSNQWCGELAAMHEFNAENSLRKIDVDLTLPGNRPDIQQRWHQKMYVCHIFDHEVRDRVDPKREIKIKPGGNMPSCVIL